jgi:uncharacterized protein YbjT (DUF2867 family)
LENLNKAVAQLYLRSFVVIKDSNYGSLFIDSRKDGMKILLTGATGYIGKRLLPVLVQAGHYVVCCVRDLERFNPPESLRDNLEAIEVDLLEKESLKNIPTDIDGAYYLVHSMSSADNYAELEQQAAVNFRERLNQTSVEHLIYLSGIVNQKPLSKHLQSRKTVEDELDKGAYHLTTLRAGIIIGSGSASFEIIRDLVEKLPVMIAPKWLHTRCQPVGISDVMLYLGRALFCKPLYDHNYDIGCTDVLSYKEMLLGYAKVRGLKRSIFIVPVMTPRLSSYWLYFVTSTTYKLACALVESMRVEVVCRTSNLNKILGIDSISYEEALEKAFAKIDNNEIVSSWKDSKVSGVRDFNISDFVRVPSYGCFTDVRSRTYDDRKRTIAKIWGIGGKNGWYHANILWKLRGLLDKMFGGVGLRRGRTSQTSLAAGDALDFWRVMYANRSKGRLLLFAEMKLPGEAWLEFSVEGDKVVQTATFRPKGVLGRLYWYAVLPFHGIVFSGMLNKVANA